MHVSGASPLMTMLKRKQAEHLLSHCGRAKRIREVQSSHSPPLHASPTRDSHIQRRVLAHMLVQLADGAGQQVVGGGAPVGMQVHGLRSMQASKHSCKHAWWHRRPCLIQACIVCELWLLGPYQSEASRSRHPQAPIMPTSTNRHTAPTASLSLVAAPEGWARCA